MSTSPLAWTCVAGIPHVWISSKLADPNSNPSSDRSIDRNSDNDSDWILGYHTTKRKPH